MAVIGQVLILQNFCKAYKPKDLDVKGENLSGTCNVLSCVSISELNI